MKHYVKQHMWLFQILGTLLFVLLLIAVVAGRPKQDASVEQQGSVPPAEQGQPAPPAQEGQPAAPDGASFQEAAVQPTPGLLTEVQPAYVPILMYHYVRTVSEAEDELGYALSVAPDVFEAQLAWLRDQGYTSVRMDHLARCLRKQDTCPEKMIALTFDDGYDDASTNALPLLTRYGFVGTFYIVTGFVGQPGYMTWEQINALKDGGMEIGSHTINHRDLTAISVEEATDEIARSRTLIEEQISIPVQSFCYPIGAYSSEIATIVQQAGYTNAVTTMPEEDLQRLYELPRRRIRGGESVEALAWYVEAHTLPPTPMPTPVLAEGERAGEVTDDGVTVRSNPGTDSPPVESGLLLSAGEQVAILAEAAGAGCENWFEIRTASGERGWVCAAFVR